MKIRIKRIDKDLPLPEYHSPGAVAFDLVARVKTEIPPREIGRVPANVIVETPKGYMLFVKDRSSTAKKKGLLCTPGFVDQDYCGDKDELQIQFWNFTDQVVVVDRGERLGQAAFIKIEKAEWDEIDEMKKPSRGGFGSTGH